MRPVTVSVGPVGTVSATNIATSQTPAGAGALTLNGALVTGGVAILPTPQRVKITTADTTHTFTITGTSPTGTLLTEVVTSNGTSVQSALDYSTVTSIVISGAATAAVTAGTSGVASTPWVRFDDYAPAPVSIQCTVTGTVNYTIQQTLDDPNSATNPVTPSAVTWLPTSDTAGVAATTSIQSNYAYVPVFARVLLNSGSGSVIATFLQAGATPY
jgi:hypothetical protein